MRANKRQSSWIVTLSLAAIAAAYMTLAWMPGRRAIKEMGQQLETKQAFVAQSSGLSSALLAAQKEVDKTEAAANRWEKAAPGRKELSSLFGNIDAAAKDAHLSIGRFDPQPYIVYEKIRQIPITMVCAGKFADIHEFLRNIERLPPAIWVESLRLERPANGKDVQCELNLAVFSDNFQTSDYAKHND